MKRVEREKVSDEQPAIEAEAPVQAIKFPV